MGARGQRGAGDTALGAAGRRDPRNRLNDLTGREWVYFLQSVQATAYPARGPESATSVKS